MTGTDGLAVLIVDDNQDFAENLAELVRAEGAEASCRGSLRAGREAAREGHYQLALLDQKLPDGRGTDLLVELRGRDPDLVAVLITGYASLPTTVAALNHGAFAFVGKDSDPAELAATLSRAVGRARLLRQARRMRETQDALLSANPDLLLLMDAEGQVRFLNRHDPRVTVVEDGAGRSLSEVLVPELVSSVDWEEWIAELREGGAEVGGRSLSVGSPPDESVFDVRLLEVKVEPRSQLLLRFVDISDRVRLEKRLGAAESMAALGRLSSSVAHEIRNPIAGIRVLAQMMDRSFDPDDARRESTQEILSLSDRLSATITELLEFARPEQSHRQAFDLARLVDEVLVEARRWPRFAAQRLESRHEADGPWLQIGNPSRLRSAVAALVENALDATHPDGQVVVRLRRPGETEVELSVEDDGAGLGEVDPASLFEPFVTHKIQGTGLGLSIVRRVVEAHGGSVDAGDSELGGARFSIHLGAAPSAV